MSGRGNESLFFTYCLKPLDEIVPIKQLLRVWGPRFEFIVRLLLVATFLDDSFRVATHFSEHTKQIGDQGYLHIYAEESSQLVGAVASFALGIGLLAQVLGSLCLLALFQPDVATKALIGWSVAQPVLYAQLSNVGFVAESLSLIGGLIILRAHLGEQARRHGRKVTLGGGELCAPDGGAPEVAIARTQLLGRLLLPAVYLYRAKHTAGLILRGLSLSMFVVDTAVLFGLVLGCALVAFGLRSRTVALSLAIINIFFMCYQHPFFRFSYREGGQWKYDEAAMRHSMPTMALPKGISQRDDRTFEPWQLLDLHRYYFFHGLSTAGALLLLAQFGPGEIAVEEDEVLISDAQSGYTVVARD